jgi:hypothetical protein
VDAGLHLMLEKGYHHTGIQDVLQAAGVPKGSFYYYFPSKQALVAPQLTVVQGHSVFEFNTDESQCLCRLGSQPAASRRYVGFARPP